MNMSRNTMFRIQRETLCMTQKQVAEKIGLSASYISNFENGLEVSEEMMNALMGGITGIRDTLYPSDSYERKCYTINLHLALFNAAETLNDKQYFLNKVVRDATYLQEDLMNQQKQKFRRW